LPPEGEPSSDNSDEPPPAHDRSVALGLIPAPEMPHRLAQELSTKLPELLSRRVDERVSWEVSVICDPLTGSDPDAVRVIDAGRERMEEEGWNLAICLTDLPIRTDGRPVVATVSTAYNVAVLSLPPLGVTLLRRRVREATLQLVSELYEGSPELGRAGEYRDAAEGNSGQVRRPGSRAHRLVERRLTELISPIRRIAPTNEEDDEVDVRFVSPKVRGHVRLLAGMVLANRPWRLFTTMKGTLAAAFATAAYALVMPIIWQMADSLSWVRLLALMVLAVVAMVVWIIVAHHLWERPAAQEEAREQAALYNASTALTLGVAVLFSYAVLFVLVLLAAGFFLESGFLQSNLGHPVGVSDYVRLAWMATSLATVAGALGSGLEDEETVREATYGYRQQRRNAPNEPEGSADS
jgi:chromate transport protein ChrA